MKQKNKRITSFISIVIAIVTFVVVTVSSVGASYLKRSEDVLNTFKPAVSIIPDIEETFDNAVKKDVYFEVGDTDYPVYVRAKIVVTWQDKDGIVYYDPPVATGDDPDYSIDLNLADWTPEDDGFYYFKSSVESGGATSTLIKECKQLKSAPVDGYTLSVEILVQTIQAVGYTDGANGASIVDAWKDATWKVS